MGWKIILLTSLWLIFFLSWIVCGFIYRTTRRKKRDKNWPLFLICITSITAIIQYFTGEYLLRKFELSNPFSYLSNILGIILMFLGLSLAIWSRVTLGYFWSGSVAVIENQPVIKKGPYVITRHPIYTGVIMMLWGSFFLEEIGVILIIAILGTISLLWKARLEEMLLVRYKDKEYLDYQKEVSGIPLLGKRIRKY